MTKPPGWVAGAAVLFLGVIGATAAWMAPPADRPIALAETSLAGRTRAQRLNAERCAASLNGAVIRAGEVWSFNQRVGSWTRDQGYRRAPVSYNGQLIDSWGGGVCQTSTTLYHAALMAGMDIIERHPHQFAASYAPPGRDAAVAYPDIDLRLRNPWNFPVRVDARAVGGRLRVQLRADHPVPLRPRVETQVLATKPPATYAVDPGTVRHRNGGKPGYEVLTWRVWPDGRELVSHDQYPTMHRIEVRR